MNGQFLGDNGDGTATFADATGREFRVPSDNPMAQSLMPPPMAPPAVDQFGGPQIQASPMPPQGMPPQAMGGEPMGAPMPMGPGADANMAAMNPQAAPEPMPQAPAAPMRPGKPLTVKQEAAQAQALTDQSMSMATGAMDSAKQATTDQAAIDSQMHLAIADETAKREYDLGVMRQKHEGEKMQAEQEKSTLRNGITQAVDARKSWKMDRGRLLKQMDGGDKALGLLSMILGAFAQTMNKGQSNPAMDVLMKRVDQDADDQRQEYDQLGENVGEAKSSYKEYLDQLGDKDAAFAATKAERIDSYKSQLEMLAARSSSERVKTQAAMAIADLDTKKAGIIGQAADSAHQRVQQRRQLGAQYASLAEGRRQFDLQHDEGKRRFDIESQAKEQAALAAGKTVEAQQIKQERELGVGAADGVRYKNKDGTAFLARSPESAIEIAKMSSAVHMVSDLAIQLEELRKMSGSEMFKSSAYRKLQSIATELDMSNKDIHKLGVLTGPDMELLQKIKGTSDPTELRGYIDTTRQMVTNAEKRVTYRMAADGYTGDFKVTKMSDAKAEEASPLAAQVKALSTMPSVRPVDFVDKKAGIGYEEAKKKAWAVAKGEELSPSHKKALGEIRAAITDKWSTPAQKEQAMVAARALADSIRGKPELGKVAAELDKVVDER